MSYKKIFKSDLFTFLLFLIIIYSIFRYSETFDKGFDIVEDQILIKTDQSFESKTIPTVFEEMMKNDVEGLKRFRPLWVFYLFTLVKIFGVNLLLMNIFVAILCICTSFLLFKFCRIIGFSYLQSFLFALLTIIGPATETWSRILDAEIIGMLMLSFSLYFMSKSIYSNLHQSLYKTLFIISLLLTSLCKESFLIATPAIVFLYVWLYSSKNSISLIKSLKENYIVVIAATIVSAIIFITLVKVAGINQNNKYAGVDVNLFSVKTISTFFSTVFGNNMFLIILFGIFIFFEHETENNKIFSKNFKKKSIVFLLTFAFMLLVITPQLILYYKTGFTGGRYYFPYLLGFSFSLIYLLKLIFDSNSISSFIKHLYLSTIIFFLIFELTTVTIPSLKNYSRDCKNITEVLKSVTNSTDKVLLFVMDPVQNYPQVYTFKIYLDYLKGQKEYKYDMIKKEGVQAVFADTSFYNTFLKLSKKNLWASKIDSANENSDIGNIIVFNTLEKKFIDKNRSWFSENNFEKQKLGGITLYLKK